MGYGYGRDGSEDIDHTDGPGERYFGTVRAEITQGIVANYGDARGAFSSVMEILQRGIDKREVYDRKAAVEALKTMAGNSNETARQHFIPLFQENLPQIFSHLEDDHPVIDKMTRTLFSILKERMPEVLKNTPLIVRDAPPGVSHGKTVLFEKNDGKIMYVSDSQQGTPSEICKSIFDKSFNHEIANIPHIIDMLDEAIKANQKKPSLFVGAWGELGRVHLVLEQLGVFGMMPKEVKAPFVEHGIASASPTRRPKEPTENQRRLRGYFLDERFRAETLTL